MASRRIPKPGCLVVVIWQDSGASHERGEVAVAKHTLQTMVHCGRLDFVNRRRIVVSWEWDYDYPFDQADNDINRSAIAIQRKNIVRCIPIRDVPPPQKA